MTRRLAWLTALLATLLPGCDRPQAPKEVQLWFRAEVDVAVNEPSLRTPPQLHDALGAIVIPVLPPPSQPATTSRRLLNLYNKGVNFAVVTVEDAGSPRFQRALNDVGIAPVPVGGPPVIRHLLDFTAAWLAIDPQHVPRRVPPTDLLFVVVRAADAAQASPLVSWAQKMGAKLIVVVLAAEEADHLESVGGASIAWLGGQSHGLVALKASKSGIRDVRLLSE